MKVMFDHQIFSVQAYGGYTKYFVALARALRATDGVQAQIVAPAHVNEYLQRADAPGAFSFRMRSPRRGLKHRPLLTAPLFRLAAALGRPDVIHETHHILRGGHLPRGVPVVATCHDMILERHGGGADAIARKRAALERADAIVCISQSTRNQLLARYPHLQSRASVVHHGVDPAAPYAAVALELPIPYVLFVGTRGGYKNFATALQALGSSSALHDDFHLVCFGGGPFTAAEREQARRAGLPEKRLLHISGSDELLAHAYRHAAALLYPSLEEGFGMPLTEAMVQGCPVLCGRTSCFPEICGDAAMYFDDPADVGSMRHALDTLLGDDAQRAHLAQLGRLRAAAFTWQACAAGTAAAYRSALGARGAASLTTAIQKPQP